MSMGWWVARRISDRVMTVHFSQVFIFVSWWWMPESNRRGL
jgi:hypothetical protein